MSKVDIAIRFAWLGYAWVFGYTSAVPREQTPRWVMLIGIVSITIALVGNEILYQRNKKP